MTDAAEAALDVPGLPEDALVVRGGDPRADGQLERMIESARNSNEEGEGYALSTFAGHDPSKSREELLADIAEACNIPHSKLAVTTVRKVVESGMKLVPDGGSLPCHVNIDLGSEPDPELVTKFVDLFEAAENNPAHTGTRRGEDAR